MIALVRSAAAALATLAVLGTLPDLVQAQSWPSRPVRLVVTFPTGGAPDILARLFSEKAQLGQPVIVENRPGAGTVIGTEFAATRPPDGYTVLLISPSFAINPSLLTSLPYDPFKTYFLDKEPIRVQSVKALPSGDDRALRPVESLQHTESNYALMMHFSGSLGVNCTYCHNSQSFSSWSGSRPQRVTAWHGIQMLRDLNLSYFDPLKPTYPAADLGPLGDAPKANCATCHQGANKPLLGVSMLGDYPELKGTAAK